jgi:hypothetical protein
MKDLTLSFGLIVLVQAAFPNAAMSQFDIQIHPNATMHQIEPSIAVHPTNPNVVLALGIAASTVSSVVSTGWHVTTDGGGSWTGRDTLNTHSDLGLGMVDPAAGIDADGYLYVAGLYGPLPPSALDVYVVRSTDNGMSWSHTTVTSPANADRTHMTIDVNPGSPFRNHVYVAYTEFSLGMKPIRFIRSTDRGESFTAPVSINGSVGSLQSFGANLAVGEDSVLYVTWSGFDAPFPGPISLGFNVSTDGGMTWATPTSVRTLTGIGLFLTKGPNAIFAYSNPSMCIDRSTGPRRGWIYIVYPDKNPVTPDIFLIRSTDGGHSWSDPRPVNQDNSDKDQWHSWLSVDPATGNLFVVYYDSRNFPANDSAQVYVSSSTDGGDTFEDLLVSDVPFLPATFTAGSPPPPGYMGGYIGIAALQNTVYPIWNDNRNGMHQIYTSRTDWPVPVEQDAMTLPVTFGLEQNYPNPFNPRTTIRLSLPRSGFATLRVFNMLGEQMTTLVSGNLSAGFHRAEWDASDLPSGVYFYRIHAGEFVQSRKLVLLR